MASSVNSKTVNTHLDEGAVAVDKIFSNGRVFGIQVNAVAGNLSPPTCVVVPVELAEVMPVIMGVVVLVVGILHLLQTVVILLSRRQIGVVGR